MRKQPDILLLLTAFVVPGVILSSIIIFYQYDNMHYSIAKTVDTAMSLHEHPGLLAERRSYKFSHQINAHELARIDLSMQQIR